jgi:hypothetical protein|tara:strand:- start:466 stop:618 length:153 start_codon:yes stop_codon:yes gene_type:complete
MPKHSNPPYTSTMNKTIQRYITTIPKPVGENEGEYIVKIEDGKMTWTPKE